MKDKELECLFIKHNVPNNISFLAKVQTLLSKHNCKYCEGWEKSSKNFLNYIGIYYGIWY